jgi:hypothetical protein
VADDLSITSVISQVSLRESYASCISWYFDRHKSLPDPFDARFENTIPPRSDCEQLFSEDFGFCLTHAFDPFLYTAAG